VSVGSEKSSVGRSVGNRVSLTAAIVPADAPALIADVGVTTSVMRYPSSTRNLANIEYILQIKKVKVAHTDRRVPELIPVLGSQPAGDVSQKPGGRLPLLSARPAVTPATLKRAAINLAAW